MQTQTHPSLVTIIAGAVLALAFAAPVASAATPSARPAFPNAVPSQPGALTGQAADTNAARAQERYLASYGDAKPLTPVSAPAGDGGVDWASIGIGVGGTVMLTGALIALLMRTRRRTGRAHVAA
jgi:hypothetical protein